MYQNLPKSTKQYKKVPKGKNKYTQKYQKNEREQKIQLNMEKYKMYQNVPKTTKNYQKVRKRNKT